MKNNTTVALQVSDLDHQRIDGTRVYLKELLKRFGKFDTETKFHLYHRNIFNPLLTPPNFLNYFVKMLVFPFAWMQTRFAWEIFRMRPKKLFLPIQAAPIFLPKETEVTVTIHDLAFRRYPETFPKTHLFKLNFLLGVALRRADKIIAVSESTKKDVVEFFPHISEDRIRVIHHGFDGEFFGTKLSSEELRLLLTSYSLLPGQYVLYVGALQPRKNLVRLIQAFDEAKKTAPDMKLVLAGEPAWLSQSILEVREKSPYKKDILLTGAVSFSDLRSLYQGARFFVFPSLYEGFGLPILEAFASGVPVMTANNSSLLEVGGDAVLFCDALDVSDMTEKLLCLWSDEQLRRTLIQKGKEQLQKFSWDKCARETLEYIQS
ncbi:MAG: glycosyltransferase family 1 protein [Candidatus Moranbacteria bacterium]|nr:glycosyltransferase family 1 protein [Candidatus Moranbacteria bacterium]MDD3965042.1 glycosyltransferase family 1 protein [Candidatus Moranbacteria bacterium]